jgi:N-acylethanolamine-hydrolysing acid amidase
MYEYSTACTGVLICTNEGKMLHGRNLDFPMWGHLANLLVHAEYYKGGKLVFRSDLIVGSVFALTGSKPGAFSVNVDTRTAKNFDQDLISVLIDNAIPTCWLVQKVLIEETNFDAAVKRLKSTRIGGPVYYIVSGTQPYEGTVIERDVNSTHASYSLSKDTWFLVQTNYDRDQPDPIIDERRTPVEKFLRQRGNNITEQQLIDEVMSQWPTFNI